MGNSNSIDLKYYGFRIYKIIKDGPLDKVGGLRELEDFIIPPQKYEKKIEFSKFLHERKGLKTELSVYSMRTRKFKKIEIIPDDSWTEDKSLGLLGANVRYENWSIAHENVLRVLKVTKNGLLDRAGVVEKDDYIIAIKRIDSDIVSLNQEDKDPLELFGELLEALIDKDVQLFLYNRNSNYRLIDLHLKRTDKGELLGCDLGRGKLHEFPREYTIITDSINQPDQTKELHSESINIEQLDSGNINAENPDEKETVKAI